MEARGTSYVNIADAAAFQSRYNLRFTGNINTAELPVTKVEPHHCATTDETANVPGG